MLLIIGIVLLAAGAGIYFVATTPTLPPAPIPSPTPTPTPRPSPTPLPSPTPSPSPKPTDRNCTADSQCPTGFLCEATESAGTACAIGPDGQPVDPNCVPTTTITKGSCKVKKGYSCSANADCAAGNLCHASICTNPVGKICNFSGDPVCGPDYQCIRDCGPPVSREDDPEPGWHCILNEEAVKPKVCPICLAGSTLIDTPSGSIPVKDIKIGMLVWTTNRIGQRVSGVVTKTSQVPVSKTHTMVYLVLDDGRELFVSPGHPTTDGRTIGDLAPGTVYDGALVISTARVSYGENVTYDIVPSGGTGFYWANGILIASTLR